MTTTDILLLGATGYTGRLISDYLCSHPDRLAYNLSLTLAGRSLSKLTDVFDSLPNQTNVRMLQISDLSTSLDLAHTALVINTIGPYFIHSPTVAQLCALSYTHYLDLSGEPHQMFSLIHDYNTHATALSTRSLIIPACGYDSIPSDLSVYLSAKALLDNGIQPGQSTTVHSASGGLSGGTIATALSTISIPRNLIELSTTPFSASPIVGHHPHPKLKFIYKLILPGFKTYTGSYFPMSSPNTQVVQRSYGLRELDHLENPTESDNSKLRYGSKFTYDEFFNVPNSVIAFLLSSTIFTFMACLLFKPFSKLATFLLPSQGSGPSKASLPKGHFKATNITFAASEPSESPTKYAETILKGSGDPGYLLTSIMISECALSILIPSDHSPASASSSKGKGTSNLNPKINPSLPKLAHSGGLLTPSTALGDVLVQRLLKTGKFSVETAVWDVDHKARSDN